MASDHRVKSGMNKINNLLTTTMGSFGNPIDNATQRLGDTRVARQDVLEAEIRTRRMGHGNVVQMLTQSFAFHAFVLYVDESEQLSMSSSADKRV